MISKPPARFEFALLQFLAANEPLSVRDIYEGFGKPRGFIRGTVVKTMDRLLKKGLVERELVDGTFLYRSRQNADALDRQLVDSFIRERLGGRLKPIAAYLLESKAIDPKELRELRAMLEQIDDGGA